MSCVNRNDMAMGKTDLISSYYIRDPILSMSDRAGGIFLGQWKILNIY